MKIDIHLAKNGELTYIGYIENEIFDSDRCWELCNWKHWRKELPDNLHANIFSGSGSHGVCFTNPDTKEIWMTKSIGWFIGNESEINEYIQKNKDEIIWL